MKKILILLAVFCAFFRAIPVYAGSDLNFNYQPLNWNSYIKENEQGNGDILIYSKMVNYYDENLKLKRINVLPLEDQSGFHVKDAPYQLDLPLLSDAEFIFTANTVLSENKRGFLDKPPLIVTKRYTQISPVQGELVAGGVLYKEAFSSLSADLYIEIDTTEVRSYIQFPVQPAQCVDKSFVIKVPFETKASTGSIIYDKFKNDVKEKNRKLKDGFVIESENHRKIAFHPPLVFDYNNKKTLNIEVDGYYKSGIFYGIKNIPCSYFDEKTEYPVLADTVVDFHPGASVDGYTTATPNDYWSTARAAAGSAVNSTATTAKLGVESSGSANKWYNIFNSYTLYDITSLPSGVTINSGSLLLYGETSYNGLSSNMSIVVGKPNTASDTALATGDHVVTNWTLREQATRKTQASWSTSGYNTFPLTASGINTLSLTAITKFGFMSSYVFDNLEPTYGTPGEGDWVTFYTSEDAGFTRSPVLRLTYTVPGGGSSGGSTGGGVGSFTGAYMLFSHTCGTYSGSTCRSWSTYVNSGALLAFRQLVSDSSIYPVQSNFMMLFIFSVLFASLYFLWKILKK